MVYGNVIKFIVLLEDRQFAWYISKKRVLGLREKAGGSLVRRDKVRTITLKPMFLTLFIMHLSFNHSVRADS